MKTVLVSGASGIVGYGILKSLRKSGKDLRLIGSSIYDDSVAPAFCDAFLLAPKTSDPSYLKWLLSAIRAYKIDLIIPGIEIDLYFWAEHESDISETGVSILLNNRKLIQLSKDKGEFYTELVKTGDSCVIETVFEGAFESLKSKFGLPFLLKPRIGFGGRGIVRVYEAEMFEKFNSDLGKKLLAQPIVGDDEHEYSTSAFCDGNGSFTALLTLKRKLSKDGFTEKAEVVMDEQLEQTVNRLCGYFNPIGPTNFQFRKHQGIFKLLEINPRISSATSIRTAFGYNEAAMTIDFMFEQKLPSQPEIRFGKAVRYVEDAIFYL